MRRITIGVNWQGPFDRDALIADAKVADEAGVHLLTVAEAWGRDPFTTLALIAYETSHIQLGTSIVNIFSRTPGALAQHFTTLDALSGGRMMIGLGTSGPQVIEHFHGMPFDRPITRMREYIEIINALVAGEPLHYHGKIFELDRGFTLRDYQPTAVRNHIPIFVGAMGPRSIRLTAELADGWLPGRTPRDQWSEQVKHFRSLVAAAGRDPESVEVEAPGGARVTDDAAAAHDGTRRQTAFYMARMGDLHYAQFKDIGLGEVADAVRVAWRDGGSAAAYAAVPDDVVESLGYAGPVEGCVEWMEAQRDAGYSLHSVSVDERDPRKRAAIYKQLVG
jgi:F420-dependent oxidoreductase-like protein